MAFELVVARYAEDLAWVRNIPPQIRVTVYDKNGDAPYPGAIRLPNVGREAHTYLHHIVKRYDTLAPLTIAGRPWSGVDLSLDTGTHTIHMDPADGYGSSELLCYPSAFDDAAGPSNVTWIPVENGAATVTTAPGERTTCSWFNMGAENGG